MIFVYVKYFTASFMCESIFLLNINFLNGIKSKPLKLKISSISIASICSLVSFADGVITDFVEFNNKRLDVVRIFCIGN